MTGARRVHERSARQALYERYWPRSVLSTHPPPLIGAFSFRLNFLSASIPSIQQPSRDHLRLDLGCALEN